MSTRTRVAPAPGDYLMLPILDENVLVIRAKVLQSLAMAAALTAFGAQGASQEALAQARIDHRA